MGSKIGDSKIFYIVVSILISVALWLYVVTVVNPNGETVIRDIPITLLGEDVLESRGLMISKMSSRTMKLDLAGKRNALLKLSKENISVTLDVSSITSEGSWALKCRVALPSTVTSGTVSPTDNNNYTLHVTVVKQVQKMVPVRGSFLGNVAPGYQAQAMIFSPAVIVVTGAEAHVNQVAYVQVSISKENLTDTYTGELAFVPMGHKGEKLTGLNVKYDTDTIFVTLPVVKVVELPLTVEVLGGGGAAAEDAEVTIEPASIVLSGSEEMLAPLKEITLGQINLAEVLGTKNYSFSIPLADGITNESGVTQATVTVTIQDLPSKVFEVDNIELINIPSGYLVTSVTKSLQVWVRGPEEPLNSISEYQIRVVADLSSASISVGQFRVPVKVYLDGGGGCGIVGTEYSISIQATN